MNDERFEAVCILTAELTRLHCENTAKIGPLEAPADVGTVAPRIFLELLKCAENASMPVTNHGCVRREENAS